MRKPRRFLTLVAVLTLGLVPAALAASGGSLTSSEYQQLSALSTRLKAKGISGAKMVAACDKTQAVSPLVSAIRASCSSTATLAVELTALDPIATSCSKQHPSTVYACVLPIYTRLSKTIASVYRAESGARSIGASRGLGDACVTGLSDPADVVAVEKQMVASTMALVADVKAKDTKDYEKDSKTLAGQLKKATADSDATSSASPVDLSSCRHG